MSLKKSYTAKFTATSSSTFSIILRIPTGPCTKHTLFRLLQAWQKELDESDYLGQF